MKVIIRMWTKDEYHKEVVVMDEEQVKMQYSGTEPKQRHIIPPIDAVRAVIDPNMFPEASEFEVIIVR